MNVLIKKQQELINELNKRIETKSRMIRVQEAIINKQEFTINELYKELFERIRKNDNKNYI